jgi:iron complex transport system ATP-binding protein
MSIRVRGLVFNRPGFTLRVPDLEFGQSRLTALVGPNGAGKTTLLKCLAALLPVPRRTLFLGDRDLSAISDGARAKLLAFVPQEHVSAFNYSVREFLLMGRAPYVSLFALPSPADAVRAEESLAFVGLAGHGGRAYQQMSSGERRLVLIARALVQDTDILVLDEPTTFLDPKHETKVLDLARRLVDDGKKTVLVTLHNLDMAMRYADDLVCLKDGAIIAHGAPASIVTEELLESMYEIPMRILRHDGRTFIVR